MKAVGKLMHERTNITSHHDPPTFPSKCKSPMAFPSKLTSSFASNVPWSSIIVQLSTSWDLYEACSVSCGSMQTKRKLNRQLFTTWTPTIVANTNSLLSKTLWSTEEIHSSYIDINIWTILGLFVAQSRTNVSLLWSFQHGKLGYSKGFLEDVHFPRKLAM